jgi:hypothetical protein
MSAPEMYELYRLENIAYDVGLNFGNTGDVAIARNFRLVNRAMVKIAGHDRRWSWLRTKDKILTVAGRYEYSLRVDAKEVTKFWMEGANRGEIIRIPEGFEEDANLTQGVPNLYDWRGVDSQGARVVTFYPAATPGIEIWYRFFKHIMPIKDGSCDVRTYWGIPPNIAELLIEVTTALAWQGINDKRFSDQVVMVSQMIDDAYAADQSNVGTRYRAQSQEGSKADDEPHFEPRFGY